MVVKRVVFGTVLCTCILGCMFAWKKMNGCYLCGDREDSLMSICGGRESIGIVHLNTMSILDTRIRIFDDEGDELHDQGDQGMRITFLGKDYGTVIILANPDKGYSEISIDVTDADATDLEVLQDKLCTRCLDQISKFSEETGYCLFDFGTRALYEPNDIEFSDYVIQCSENKTNIKILIMYTPVQGESPLQ